MEKTFKQNKGYSLVEMIIVIAIIAIMSTAALATISLINSAKSKEAGVNFDSQISELAAKSKSQIPKFDADDGKGVTTHSDYYFAIVVYKYGDKYYTADGYYNKTTDTFKTYDCENVNDGYGKSISSRVALNYVPGNKNSGAGKSVSILVSASGGGTAYYNLDSATNGWVIAFDRSGRCVSGVGTYEFSKASDKTTLDEVTINANGSHQSK